jgi:hypothetical protein
MACEHIELYLSNILRAQLDSFGVDALYVERIVNTVREQVQSCIYHWNDVNFRKALLLIGSEEGTFYKPYAEDDIRNFVVVTIRNSEVECLQSENFSEAGLSRELDDIDVKSITSAAIEYFKKVDFSIMQKEMEPPVFDKYCELSRKYPISWRTLYELACTKKQISEYGSVARLAKPNIDTLPIINEKKNIGINSNLASIGACVVSDGISYSADPQLRGLIDMCVAEEQPFVVDGFKSLTRNIEKLLLILEYLLFHNADFVTSNYYLFNGHVERRTKLIRVGRSFDDGLRNWSKTAGLGARHRVVLELATKS